MYRARIACRRLFVRRVVGGLALTLLALLQTVKLSGQTYRLHLAQSKFCFVLNPLALMISIYPIPFEVK